MQLVRNRGAALLVARGLVLPAENRIAELGSHVQRLDQTVQVARHRLEEVNLIIKLNLYTNYIVENAELV